MWVVTWSNLDAGDAWPTACYGPFPTQAAAIAWRDASDAWKQSQADAVAFAGLTAVLEVKAPGALTLAQVTP